MSITTTNEVMEIKAALRLTPGDAQLHAKLGHELWRQEELATGRSASACGGYRSNQRLEFR